jgi:hypothetical protein
MIVRRVVLLTSKLLVSAVRVDVGPGTGVAGGVVVVAAGVVPGGGVGAGRLAREPAV